MNQTIFAFGGLTEENSTTDEIKMFNEASQSWEEYDYKLKSKDTGELVAIPYPISSLDCHEDCKCGLANTIGNSGARIFGGNEADVRFDDNISLSLSFIFLSRYLSTLGLLQYYEKGKTLPRIPDAAELWWEDEMCKLINFFSLFNLLSP